MNRENMTVVQLLEHQKHFEKRMQCVTAEALREFHENTGMFIGEVDVRLVSVGTVEQPDAFVLESVSSRIVI